MDQRKTRKRISLIKRMMKTDFLSLIKSAFEKEVIKKIVFSRPREGEINKISCRLCSHRGRRLLVMEFSLPGNTVSHKNVSEAELEGALMPYIQGYRQVNLLTTLGDAEYKSKGEREVILGGDALRRRLVGSSPDFERAIEALDKKKNYILSGSEPFLIKLGISSADGRVHDKRQGKFRQINKFLEYIEELYGRLPQDGDITVYDLCSGKSYLSFAVYHYLTAVKGRRVAMMCVDLKRDVILWCEGLARELGYVGMRFSVENIKEMSLNQSPDMVISLHACDVATDIVLDTAVRLRAKIILSTPCCHRYLSSKISSPELSFVTAYPHLKNKLCEAITDALRLARLRAAGYSVSAPELTDPENTPKNTLLRAFIDERVGEDELSRARAEYDRMLSFVLGDGKEKYLEDI